jgi:V-type H+-transporting ATPase subunit G
VTAIKEAGSKKGDEVVEELLRVVTDVKPEAPERVTAPPEGR